MNEEPIALCDIHKETGIAISAANLTTIGEKRIRIVFSTGARMTIVLSGDGKLQNAASFKSADDGLLTPEFVAVLDGSAEVVTPGADGEPITDRYERGQVATVDAGRPHTTRPAKGSCIVGIMASDWKGMKRTFHPEFDVAVQKLVAG